VAEGVLLCEDVLPVPEDVLVRIDALRDLRNDEPMSVTDDAIECLLACLRFCGVVGTLGLVSYWLAVRGVCSGAVALGAGGRTSAGGVLVRAKERDERGWCLACPLPLLLKNEGRREKRPGAVAVELVVDVRSAIVHASTGGALPIIRVGQGLVAVTGPLPAWRGRLRRQPTRGAPHVLYGEQLEGKGTPWLCDSGQRHCLESRRLSAALRRQ
jgi:hypothetical protein